MIQVTSGFAARPTPHVHLCWDTIRAVTPEPLAS